MNIKTQKLLQMMLRTYLVMVRFLRNTYPNIEIIKYKNIKIKDPHPTNLRIYDFLLQILFQEMKNGHL